jgi:long-chain acyl-CoA synthetase
MNLAHILDGHDPRAVALIARNRAITYGELSDQVARVRGGLVAAGIAPGEQVVIVCGNNPYFVVAYLATIGIGAVAVPLNPASPAPELARELRGLSPSAVVLGPAGIHNWKQLPAEATASIRLTIVAEGELPGATQLSELVTAEPAPLAHVATDAVAVMMFTSGTAGPPRAAMLTHGNLRANLDQMDTAEEALRPTDVVYGVLPLFHIFGLNVVLGAALRAGATVVLAQRFDPTTAAESIRGRGITVVPGAPPLWVAFSTFDDLPADTFGSVRLALSGASRLPASAAERMLSRFGVVVCEGYGLTVAGPVVTSAAGAAHRPGSVGRVLDAQEVRLVGSDGADVLVGDAGEIWVRGPNVFAGYFDDPEATARVLTADGWLRTGDLGAADADGYLYLVDRAKDLIIVSGFNVYPAEVEEVLGSHPAVAEVGVIGVPHPHDGEAVKAYVVLREGAHTDEESLVDHAHEYLARYKCPSKVVFVDHLPRNANGKLVRRELMFSGNSTSDTMKILG